MRVATAPYSHCDLNQVLDEKDTKSSGQNCITLELNQLALP
jgi:hypothetical protein